MNGMNTVQQLRYENSIILPTSNKVVRTGKSEVNAHTFPLA